MTVTVIVVTLNRPECVSRCLKCLESQVYTPDQIIVVDSSPGSETHDVVTGFPGTVYLRNENGFGRMTASRNLGLIYATGEIIAFVDDDAFAEPPWLLELIKAYSESDIGAVGGRVRNNVVGEEFHGVNEIGKVKKNGYITGNFAADSGKIIVVDHIMGCNMSFRRCVIAELGGFREDFPGISGIREDTDMCIRVGKLGYKLLFQPSAVVEHLGAPQAIGKRFDFKYDLFTSRNHMVLLVRNFGPLSPIVLRYSISHLQFIFMECARRMASAVVRLSVQLYGSVVGFGVAVFLLVRTGNNPVRNDENGREISQKLMNTVVNTMKKR